MEFADAWGQVERAGGVAIMTPPELEALWGCVELGDMVLEIGTAYGGTASLLALKGAVVHTVDSGESGQTVAAEQLFEKLGIAYKISSYVEKSSEVRLPEMQFDLVLIDGAHWGDIPYQDMCRFAPRVKPGGWLALDDVANGHPDITKGVMKWISWEKEFSFHNAYSEQFDGVRWETKLSLFRRDG